MDTAPEGMENLGCTTQIPMHACTPPWPGGACATRHA
eukprot:CAMPEP_0204585360 /NCGR_PEP_ID=MMETSP0661-20131031/46874_1 /ASSEMBLY_ACC=CAM_ASM_000606 /TAXON_ID=109239 /ORGANISM="Alexandrium margalefi, Strain AMGDE01CS-322" /LENGTH=36 /DNA_ID= /DNA_START= /DNA_END= /DNA_ORIENTATION=